MHIKEAWHRTDGLQEAWQYVMCSEEHFAPDRWAAKGLTRGPTDYM